MRLKFASSIRWTQYFLETAALFLLIFREKNMSLFKPLVMIITRVVFRNYVGGSRGGGGQSPPKALKMPKI